SRDSALFEGEAMSEAIKLPTAKVEEGDIEMIDVFELDGDVFQMPKKVSAGIGLKYLKIQAERGPVAASYYMMLELLGKEAYEARMEHTSIDNATLDPILETVEPRGLSASMGKSSSMSRRKRSKK